MLSMISSIWFVIILGIFIYEILFSLIIKVSVQSIYVYVRQGSSCFGIKKSLHIPVLVFLPQIVEVTVVPRFRI